VRAFGKKGLLPRLFCRDGKASFPSGDTAGAVATVYPVLRYTNNTRITCAIGICLVVLSCVGRMYWLAHHLFDTVAGVVLALVVAYGLERSLCVETDAGDTVCECDWWHVLMAHSVMVACVLGSRMHAKTKLFGSGTIPTKAE